jgi:hypothetical protein
LTRPNRYPKNYPKSHPRISKTTGFTGPNRFLITFSA